MVLKIFLKRSFLLSLLAVPFFQGCTTDNGNQQDKKSPVELKSDFNDFQAAFSAVTLPYLLPNADNSQKELDRKLVQSLFDSASFQPVYGDEKDVPDLAENSDASKYFAVGMVQADSVKGYIIHKQDDGDYFYLCTFDKNGKFIDGICLSFIEGTDGDKTERTASINDDQSIMIRQTDTVNGKPGEQSQTRIFEIENDGSIHSLQAGPSRASLFLVNLPC